MQKTLGIVTFLVGAVSLLAWPLFGILSVFMFDAPFHDPLDKFLRYASVLLVLSYPIGYFVAVPFFIIKFRSGNLGYRHALLGLTPVLHLVLAFLGVTLIMAYQNARQHPDTQIAENVVIENRGSQRWLVNKQGETLVSGDIVSHMLLEDGKTLLVGQSLVEKLDVGDGSTLDVVSFVAPITYFAVNAEDESVSRGYTRAQIMQTYGLSEESYLFSEEMLRERNGLLREQSNSEVAGLS